MTRREFGPGGWTPDRLPDLSGKTYVITGGNSGIGFEAARMLGERGAAVRILCRNHLKAKEALAELQRVAPDGAFTFTKLDLATLSSIADAAEEVRAECPAIDGLIFNAGIMMPPSRQLTANGFEMQFGVNHLGHFALGAALCDVVEKTGGRFVSVASIAHRFANGFRFDDLMFDSGYSPTGAYAQSKLANLSFAMELQRRLAANDCKATAYACHPGWSATNLQSTGPGAILGLALKPMNMLFAQPAAKGAIPTVLCAAAEEAVPGDYYGPVGWREFSGPVDHAGSTRKARDEEMAAQLWAISEELTESRWSIL